MAGNVTVEDVFTDFKGRQAGLIKAFTTGVMLRNFTSSAILERRNCLFGFPNETWEVKPPDETVPPNVPEPIIDKMQEKEWLSKVAILSDVWLLSLAFCCAATIKFGKSKRNRLFQIINDLPTIAEALTEAVEQAKDMAASASAAAHDNSNKSRSKGKTLRPLEKARLDVRPKSHIG